MVFPVGVIRGPGRIARWGADLLPMARHLGMRPVEREERIRARRSACEGNHTRRLTGEFGAASDWNGVSIGVC